MYIRREDEKFPIGSVRVIDMLTATFTTLSCSFDFALEGVIPEMSGGKDYASSCVSFSFHLE
jgi:hypothetical protein